MKRTLFLSAVATFIMATAFSQSKVYIIPVLHGMHKTNPQYTYDSIQALVRRLNPDVIAVEIRAEDIGTDTAYLKQNYPYEMWMMPYWFPSATIAGFDWLGQELEGKLIPARYWKDHSRIKALQRLLSTDSLYQNKLAACQLYDDERLRILETSSLKAILQSNDAILVKEYYNCLDQQLKGSDYEELSRFYDTRNFRIQKNVGQLAQRHAGKTIVVLTGDDHYPYLREYLLRQKLSLGQPL
jgi:hypothetical protein